MRGEAVRRKRGLEMRILRNIHSWCQEGTQGSKGQKLPWKTGSTAAQQIQGGRDG